ncbi:MAG: long-chain fatty acid--CoA ligase [Rhodospirillaceae bacterium]|nr:MAG: long-chain fatty acid--CoA ligase [Rhodospirillaceae bacterium]
MHTHLLLDMAAGEAGPRIAIGPKQGGVSYAHLLGCARAAAKWIKDLGVERVAYVGLNADAFPILMFGSAMVGKPFSPINYRLTDGDLRRLLERTAPSVVVADDDMMARVEGVAGVKPVSHSAFRSLVEKGPRIEPEEEAPEDIAILLFTSGTTGEPKAAVLRHRHLTSYVISTQEFLNASDDEAALVSVPPYHIAGISAVLTSTYIGRRIVYLSAFTPEAWVDLAANEKITHAMLVPTMLGRILDVLEARKEKLPDLKHLSYGGGRMPAAVIERALKALPHADFVNAYGLTETSSTISILAPDDHRRAFASDDPFARRRLGSVGRPLPTLELTIRGPGGEELPPNEVGEVWVRGDQVSGEYVGKMAVRDDGWFPTNDSGFLDDEGYLFVEGRLDDVIVRGGENISPGEIEDVLRLHPDVADCAVLGVHDDAWGERVVAAVVSKGAPDPESLKTLVRSRLRSTKVPEEIVYRSELPYNETGKLLRRALKAELSKGAGEKHGACPNPSPPG